MPEGNRSPRERPVGRSRNDAARDTTSLEEALDDESPEESPRDWLVVFALVTSLLVIPWGLIMLPGSWIVSGPIGLPFRDAYLVVPLIPALGLGVIAVWSAVAARRSG